MMGGNHLGPNNPQSWRSRRKRFQMRMIGALHGMEQAAAVGKKAHGKNLLVELGKTSSKTNRTSRKSRSGMMTTTRALMMKQKK